MARNKLPVEGARDASPGAGELLREAQAIKQLLILLLAKLGADSIEIGNALGVAPGTVRKWPSFSKVSSVSYVAKKK